MLVVFKKLEHDRGQPSCFRDKMRRLHELPQGFLLGSLGRPVEQVLVQDNTDHFVCIFFIDRNPAVHIEQYLVGLHNLGHGQVGRDGFDGRGDADALPAGLDRRRAAKPLPPHGGSCRLLTYRVNEYGNNVIFLSYT